MSYPIPANSSGGQNPMLMPQLGQPFSNGNSTQVLNPAQVLALYPRAAAQCTLTFTTNPTDDDVLTLTLTNPVLPSGSLSVSFTASSDTTTTTAAKLAAALTSSLTAMAYQVFGTSLGAVLTVNELGPVGNSTVVTFASTGSTTAAFGNQNADTVVVGGAAQATDVVTLRFTNSNFAGGHVDISHTVVGGDTLATIATALNTGINANTTLATGGISSTNPSSAHLLVKQVGPDFATLSDQTTGTDPTETLTVTDPSGILAGGSGPVIPTANFNFTEGPAQLRFLVTQPVVLSDVIVADLVAASSPIV